MGEEQKQSEANGNVDLGIGNKNRPDTTEVNCE